MRLVAAAVSSIAVAALLLNALHPAPLAEPAHPRRPSFAAAGPAAGVQNDSQGAGSVAAAGAAAGLRGCAEALALPRPLSTLEAAAVEVLQTLQRHPNVTVWPVGGTLIHLLRHGRFSDYEKHDQEYDLDLAVAAPGNDTQPLPDGLGQWLVDTLAAVGALRPHRLKPKRSPPGTGTCRRWAKGQHIACKHWSLQLHFDFFLGRPVDGGVHYDPLGVQPWAMLHPMRRCRAWDTWIHCPHDPYAVLKRWGVSTGYEVKEGCLVFPRHMQKLVSTWDAAPHAERQAHRSETEYLLQRAANLSRCGYASFTPQIEADAECQKDIRTSLSV